MPDELELDFGSDVLEGLPVASTAEEEPSELEQTLAEVLEKEETELTDEERTLLEENEDVVTKLQKSAEAGDTGGDEDEDGKGGEDDGVILSFMKEEGFLEEEAEFEDDLDGLKSYLSKRDPKRDMAVIGSFLKAHPEVAKVYNHVVVEKKPFESLVKQVTKPEILNTELKSISATATEEEKSAIIDSHVKLIKASLVGKMPDSIITATIKSAVESGETEQLAKDALATMNTSYEEQIAAMEAESRQAAKDAEDAEINAIKAIKGLVSKGALAGNVLIPESEKQSFVEHLTIPVDAATKETKYDKTLASLTPEENMLLDYLVYIKAKTGKMDLNALKYKSTVKKFLKNAKEKNSSRLNRGKGGKSRDTFGGIDSLPSHFSDLTM